ncbi:MAG: potassium channel family protein [Flavobacteriaceae bacterium]
MLFFWRTLLSFWRDPAYRALLFATNFFLAIGTVAYRLIEGWSWLDSLYFSVITLTTIGYGDFSPQTDLGKLFTMEYIIVGVALILGFVNTLFLHYKEETIKKRNNKKQSE